MKKNVFIMTGVVAMATLVLFACKKKVDDATIHPTYKEEASGTASNPNPNNVTVTGTTTTNNPATENTSIVMGGGGWSNPSCISTNSLYLKGINGDTEVTLTFASPPMVGSYTYNVASTPGVNAVAMSVVNAPDQPSGVIWYGRSGVVTVNSSTSAVNAVITGTGVMCVQSTFNFPQVTLYGSLGCN